MEYRVELTSRASKDLEEIYAWVVANAPLRGPLWFNRFEQSILSLRIFPERCPLEPSLSTRRHEVRKLLFGRRHDVYRIYFTVIGGVVHVLHIRHGARKLPPKV